MKRLRRMMLHLFAFICTLYYGVPLTPVITIINHQSSHFERFSYKQLRVITRIIFLYRLTVNSPRLFVSEFKREHTTYFDPGSK